VSLLQFASIEGFMRDIILFGSRSTLYSGMIWIVLFGSVLVFFIIND